MPCKKWCYGDDCNGKQMIGIGYGTGLKDKKPISKFQSWLLVEKYFALDKYQKQNFSLKKESYYSC